MSEPAKLTVAIPPEGFTIYVGQTPTFTIHRDLPDTIYEATARGGGGSSGAGMSEQQAWIVELCQLAGFKPYLMHSGFGGVKILTPSGQQDVSISEDGVYIVGPGWRVRVHDKKLPEAFRRALETGVGDDMPEGLAKLHAIKATAEGCAE